MKNTDTLSYIFLKPKIWGSIFILALISFSLLTAITIQLIHTVTDEVNTLNEKKLSFISTLAKAETKSKLSTVEATLYSLKSTIEEYELTSDLTNLFTSMVNSIDAVENLVIFDELGNSLYKPSNLNNINVSDRDYYNFHKNDPTAPMYISEPFIGRMKHKNIFTLTLPIKNENGDFKGLYLASINPIFFERINKHLDASNLKLAVQSTRTNVSYYGEVPPTSIIESEFFIEGTPFKFILYDEDGSISIFTYIRNIILNMEKLLMIWASFSIVLITFSLFLLRRQFKISQDYMNLSNYDPLTGVYNRRAFIDKFKQECTSALRYNKNLSVIMIDIDHFKSVNDQYGHVSGDQVLKQFSQLFSESIRESDVFARIGGEEFAIFLPETTLEGAIIAANKYRTLIENHAFSTDGFVGMCTASFGVSALSELPLVKTSKQIEFLLKLADKALYEAKVTRNCVKPDIPSMQKK